MSREGFYTAEYRCWSEGDEIVLERLFDGPFTDNLRISRGDLLQVIEMLIRLHNAQSRTPDAQVHSTEESTAG